MRKTERYILQLGVINFVRMPKEAQIISALYDGTMVVICAIVEKDNENEIRQIWVDKNGLSILLTDKEIRFIGSVVVATSEIYHVFEILTPLPHWG